MISILSPNYSRFVASLLAITAVASSTLTSVRAAANFTWSGGSSTNGDWSRPTNWSGGVAPSFFQDSDAGGQSLFFTGSTRPTSFNNIGDASTFTTLTLSAGATTAFTLTGNRTFIETGGSVVNNSSSSFSLQFDTSFGESMRFRGASSINAAAGDITIAPVGGGNVNFNGLLTVNGGAGRTVSILGNIGTTNGGAAITVNTGKLVLTGSNSGYTGATAINSGGTLQLQANVANTVSGTSNVLGGNNLTANNGATLQLRSDTSVIFNGGNGLGGLGAGTVNFDVNRIGASATNQALSFAPSGFNTAQTTINVTGGNGYSLSLGALTMLGFLDKSLTLNASTANLTVASINNAGVDGAISIGGASNTTVTGAITGGGTLTKSGNGILVLSGTNTYTGATTVTAGTLQLNNVAALGSTSGVTVGSGATMDLNGKAVTATPGVTISGTGVGANGALVNNSGTAATFNGVINATVGVTFSVGGSGNSTLGGAIGTSGASTLTKVGAGTVTLGGSADNFALTATVSAGTLVLGKTSTASVHSVGSGLTVSGGTAQLGGSGGDQIYDGASVSVSGGATFDLNTFSETINGLSGAGTVDTVAGGTSTLTVGSNNATSSFSGVIKNTTGSLSLSKTGTGTQTLSGTNTYTGATTISGGVLAINGSTTSNTTVASGGTLGGSGIVGGTVTVQSGGTLAPGNSPGLLTVSGNLTLSAGSTTTMQLQSTTRGSGYDAIDLANGATITYGGTLQLDFTGFAGGWNVFDLFNFNTTPNSGLHFSAVNVTTAIGGGSVSLSRTGQMWTATLNTVDYSFNEVTGNLATIPEPQTYASAIAFLLAGLVIRRQIQRNLHSTKDVDSHT
jgi:fibronectin-binding autotransporter adhesin